MSLLDQHVSELRSNEIVLGCTAGWRGEAGTKMEGMESTTIAMIARPDKKAWRGFNSVEHKVGSAEVGEYLQDKAFPAKCLVTYRRASSTEKKVVNGVETTKDVEKLVVTAIEWLCKVDLVEAKAPANESKAKAAA